MGGWFGFQTVRCVGGDAEGGIGAIEDVKSWLEGVFAETVNVDHGYGVERWVGGRGTKGNFGLDGFFSAFNDGCEVGVDS